MKASLFGLLALQEVDNDIDELHQHKRDYPARIEELKGTISGLVEERTKSVERLAELESSFRHFQQQHDAAKEDLVKHQKRLLQIKTNREFDAVQQEIVALQHATDEYEMELLKADEEAAALRVTLSEGEPEHLQKVQAHEQEIAELAAKTRVIDDEVEKVLDRRKEAAEGIERRMLNMYERVRRGKQLAVVRVMRGACSGCWRSLPPQRINELRMNARVMPCEGCGRILVWDEDQSPS